MSESPCPIVDPLSGAAPAASALAALRGRVAALVRCETPAADRIVTGHAAIDAALGGGLARGRLHEIFTSDADHAASAAGFAAMLALRARRAGSALLWLRCDEAERRGAFHAPGFAELGGDPDTLLLALAPDPVALLRGAGDAARCAGLDAMVIECRGDPRVLDLTASRRLALAAEQSGATLLLLRIAASPAPGAADTRWRIAAAPSQVLDANAPGQAALAVELLRQRAGPGGLGWRVEWDRDQCVFREPALSGAVLPLPQRGPTAGDVIPLRRRA